MAYTVNLRSTERSENNHLRFSDFQGPGDSYEYELSATLDGYEVEELDGHDLGRFLPKIMFRASGH